MRRLNSQHTASHVTSLSKQLNRPACFEIEESCSALLPSEERECCARMHEIFDEFGGGGDMRWVSRADQPRPHLASCTATSPTRAAPLCSRRSSRRLASRWACRALPTSPSLVVDNFKCMNEAI